MQRSGARRQQAPIPAKAGWGCRSQDQVLANGVYLIPANVEGVGESCDEVLAAGRLPIPAKAGWDGGKPPWASSATNEQSFRVPKK